MPRKAREQREVVKQERESLRGVIPTFFSPSSVHTVGHFHFRDKGRVI